MNGKSYEAREAMPSSFSLSIVVPVYGCAGCLEELCSRLEKSVAPITERFEIILVDDRSPDNSWAVIISLQARHPAVKGIRLSRNFGQHVAISAGLAAASGDYAVVMDCDLQDPPEKIPELFAKLEEGYDLVLARRVKRSHSVSRRLAARLYFQLMGWLTKESFDRSYGSFSLLSRKVVDNFLKFSERERLYNFILRWLGFRMGTIDYEHQPRTIGRSAYSFGSLVGLAIDGIFFQTTVILRWIVTLGLVFAASGVTLAVFFVLRYFIRDVPPGWTSLIVVILVSTGMILFSLGIIGLYVGKIFNQTKGRPLYVVDAVSERQMTW